MSEATIFTKLQLQLWAPHAAAWLAHVGTVRQNIANYVYTVAFKNALHTMCLRFIQHFACLESKNCEHTPDIPLNFSYKVANNIIVNNCVKYITDYTCSFKPFRHGRKRSNLKLPSCISNSSTPQNQCRQHVSFSRIFSRLSKLHPCSAELFRGSWCSWRFCIVVLVTGPAPVILDSFPLGRRTVVHLRTWKNRTALLNF